jgi:site-specific DNA-methyltransferase (adenine-specific)
MDTIEGVPAANTIYNVDIFDLCAAMPSQSVDMILADLPYEAIPASWDSLIPLEPMWAAFKRIIKPRGAIVLTADQPFTTLLIASNLPMFKYTWIWEKTRPFDIYNCRNKPMQGHEDITVFSFGTVANGSSNRMNYYPQDLVKVDKQWKRPKKYNSDHGVDRPSHKLERVIEFENYPRSILKFSNPNHDSLHPTQKPVDLFRYLIRTYTLPGELVFDPTCGSGTTAVAARAEGRNFIVGDSSPEYVAIAQERLRLPFEPHVVTKADKPIPRPTVQIGDITLEQQVMFE